MIKLNYQSERKKKGYNGFLVTQTTIKRHEDSKDQQDQRSSNKQS